MPTRWRAMAGFACTRPPMKTPREARGVPTAGGGGAGFPVPAPADEAAPAGAADRFVFDPQDPVPTAGGAACCNPKVFPWGPKDQRAVEQRRDVLVYTTAPLRREVEVIGPVRV